MAKFIEVTTNGEKVLINTRWVQDIHSTENGESTIYFAFNAPNAYDQDHITVDESYEEVKMKVWGCNGERTACPTCERALKRLKGYAVPAVRCKDCDWYRPHEGSICVNPHCCKSFYGCRVRADHFCSYGERRNDENNS